MASVYDYYYENYLMLYGLYGRGRPQVDRERFEELDTELLELILHMPEDGQQVDPDETQRIINRVQEIEFVLLDDIAESLLDTKDENLAAAARGRAPRHFPTEASQESGTLTSEPSSPTP